MGMLKKRKERRTEEPFWKRGLNKVLRHGDKTSARSKKSEEGT